MKKKISTIVLSVLLGAMTLLVLILGYGIYDQDEQLNKLKEENKTLTEANEMMSESYTRLKNKKNLFGDMSKIFFKEYDDIIWVSTQNMDAMSKDVLYSVWTISHLQSMKEVPKKSLLKTRRMVLRFRSLRKMENQYRH